MSFTREEPLPLLANDGGRGGVDVMPTLLELASMAVPDDLAGLALVAYRRAGRQVRYHGEALSAEEVARLRALGYAVPEREGY